MNTDDVSHINRYAQLLTTQKATLEATVTRKVKIPIDRKSPSELVY